MGSDNLKRMINTERLSELLVRQTSLVYGLSQAVLNRTFSNSRWLNSQDIPETQERAKLLSECLKRTEYLIRAIDLELEGIDDTTENPPA